MSNDRIANLERSFTALETRYESRSVARDKEISELQQALAAALATQASDRETVSNHGSRISTIEQVKPVGVLKLWGPAVSFALAVSALFAAFVGPIKEMAAEANKRSIDTALTLSAKDGEMKGLAKQIDDIDHLGPRGRTVEP